MKTWIKSMLLASVAFLSLNAAQAYDGPHAWACNMNFKAKAQGLQIFVGYFGIEGEGEIRCVNTAGNTEVVPVSITMRSKALAPRISIGSFTMFATTGEVSISTDDPRDLLGVYRAVGAHAVLVGGVGTFIGASANGSNASLALSLQVAHGLGFNLGIDKLEIEEL